MTPTPDMREPIAQLPPRPLTGVFFRQTDPTRGPLERRRVAPRDARWHSKGDPQPVYAADSPLAALLELPRYVAVEGTDEVVLPTRRMSELHVAELAVLDLTNQLALDVLELQREDLTGGEPGDPRGQTVCRAIGAAARARSDVDGMLAPSAAAIGGTLLVIEQRALAHVVVGEQYLATLTVARVGALP